MYLPVEFIASLTETDKRVLESIYLMRCLDETILLDMFYGPEGRSADYVKRRIRKFVNHGVLEKMKYGAEKPALFLTAIGVSLIKDFLTIPDEIFLREKKKTLFGVYAANELKLDIRMIAHQIAMGRFVADFQQKMSDRNIPWTYLGEKYLSRYETFRPDGLLRIGNEDFFLEMDMNTEKKRQLRQKWDRYRRYVNSDEYFQRERNVKILFITNNAKNPELKSRRVRNLLFEEIIDVITPDFDFYVGDSETLINTLYSKLTPGSSYILEELPDIRSTLGACGFSVSEGGKLSYLTDNIPFDFYIRKVTNQKKILIEDGVPQEYFVDVARGMPMSVIKKISYFERLSSMFELAAKRPIRYVVLVDDEKEFYLNLKEMNLTVIPNVFFTTLARLKSMQFYEALYQYDMFGSLVHFTDHSLSGRRFEKTL